MKKVLFSLLSLSLFSSIACMDNDQNDHVELIDLPSERWEDFRKLRLAATTLNPVEIGVTEADELKRDEQAYKTLLEKAYDEDNNDTWMAFVQKKGELIGMAGARCEMPHLSSMRHVAKIFSVWVAPEYRKQGIGTMLINAIGRKLALSDNITQAQLQVNAQSQALTLYKRLGFKECGMFSNAVKINGKFYDSILMEREIKK